MKILQIHPTLACNRNCSFCSYSAEDRSQRLDWGVFVRYVSQADNLGCRASKVTGGGEPLMHPQIHAMLRQLKMLGWYVQLQTNGDLLTPEFWQLADDIRVSVSDDAPFRSNLFATSYCYVVTQQFDAVNLQRAVDDATERGLSLKITQDVMALGEVPTVSEIASAITVARRDLVTFWDAYQYEQGKTTCPSASESPLLGADGHLYPCCWPQNAQVQVHGYNRHMRCDGQLPLSFDGSQCVRCYYGEDK
jgi:hypothetical protein